MHASSLEPKSSSSLYRSFEKAAFHGPILKMKQEKYFRIGFATGVDNVS
jgi:hypothetical protein